MICSSCGAEVAEGVSFCPKCGAKIETAAKSGLSLRVATILPEQQASGGDTPYGGGSMYGGSTYGSAPAPGMTYGYNGNPVMSDNMMSSAANQSYSSIAMDADEPLMDIEEYYRKDCSPKTKQYVKTAYIILYIAGVFNFIIAIWSMSRSDLLTWKSMNGEGMVYIDSTLSLIGGAVLLIGAIGVHKMKSRVFAAIVCAYAIFHTIRNFAISGRFSGWLILLAGGYALYGTWMLHKDYENYKAMKTMIR